MDEGGFISPCNYFYSMISEKFRVFYHKTSLSFKNRGISHDFNVGLLQSHPGKCGTP